jgi:RNA-directed DNA polymerase
VKAFLKAGVLGEDQVVRDAVTGAPQGGIVSPLLSDIALSALDEHFVSASVMWCDFNARTYRRRKGELATYPMVRNADDFVVVAGTEAQRAEVAEVLRPMDLRLT